MGLEANNRDVDDLNKDWPLFNEGVSQGDDHLRGIKSSLQGTVFGNANEAGLALRGLKRLWMSAVRLAIRASDDKPYISYETNAGTEIGYHKFDDGKFEIGATRGVEVLPNDDRGYRITRVSQTFELFLQDTDKSFQLRDITNNKAIFSFVPNGDLKFFSENQGQRLTVSNTGVNVAGQVEITSTAPTAANHAARKDYVDSKISSLQAEIDDIKNGFAFTGPISAPTVTQTT